MQTGGWGGEIYLLESCESTMDEARLKEKEGAPSGTVVATDFQSGGRGRISSRQWKAERGQSLLFTILLRYDSVSDIPQAITLRTGLAVSGALALLAPALIPALAIKWPNDIMLNGKKTAGILTESDGKNVFIGIGVNVFQSSFTEYPNATSIFREAPGALPADGRFALLEKILSCLYTELTDESARQTWCARLNEKLFMKGESLVFIKGQADSGNTVHGKLRGVSESGGLLIADNELLTGEILHCAAFHSA
jgi:BirA family biotin operon repressor/biotin-[acetyl-CoA-carboxylase] ligase